MIAPRNFDKKTHIHIESVPEYRLDPSRDPIVRPGEPSEDPNMINITIDIPMVAEWIEIDLVVVGDVDFDAL